MKLVRPYHWRIRTNHGWLDTVGVYESDAIENMLRKDRLLNPGRTLVAIIGSGVVGREVSDEFYKFMTDRALEQEKIKKIVGLCRNAGEIVRVCEAIGFDANKALSYWACTPREKNSVSA